MYAIISDPVEDNQKLPLKKALGALIEALEVSTSTSVSVLEAEGYGETVNALDEATESGAPPILSLKEIVELLRTGEEWFYNLRAIIVPSVGAFGVLDSSAVFIEGAPEVVLEVVKLFKSVKVHDGDLLLSS